MGKMDGVWQKTGMSPNTREKLFHKWIPISGVRKVHRGYIRISGFACYILFLSNKDFNGSGIMYDYVYRLVCTKIKYKIINKYSEVDYGYFRWIWMYDITDVFIFYNLLCPVLPDKRVNLRRF